MSLTALAVLSAACAGAPTASSPPESLALTQTIPTTSTTLAEPEPASEKALVRDEVWEADDVLSDAWPPFFAENPTDSDDSAEPGDGEVAARSPSPQTPSSGGSQPPADVMSLYRGVLGTYTLTQVLATTTVAMPTVAAGTAPLTGLPSSGSSRPAVVVKIDNSSKARPQSGLNLADIVVEQEVEWGLTRFAAIFHSNRVPVVGPVRSARSTDISFLSSLGRPALAYSGANKAFDQLILQQERVQNFSAARNGGYWRDNSRRAPSNLYTDTRNFDGAGSPPPAWFHFASAPASAGVAATSFTTTFPTTSSSWTWDGTHWLRRQDGKVHATDGGAQVRMSNVIVAEVPAVDSGLLDPAGSVVPEFVWAGTGRVSVFTNGQRVDGTWTRPTLSDPAVLVDATGAVIQLMPGSSWVALVRSLPS